MSARFLEELVLRRTGELLHRLFRPASEIEDADLARKIRAKVNALNLRSVQIAGALTLLFVIAPEFF